MSDFPTASSVESKAVIEAVIEAVDMETMILSLKSLDTADLFKIMKQALALAEKRSSSTVPRTKAAASSKKAGSMPKGVVPPQLRRPRAWVDFTEKHALENGWESFTVFQSKKDKMTGEKVEEEIEMPCSEMYEGAHVYEGSITEKMPGGKQLIHKDAMSLSKQRWAPKDGSGTHEELYKEFLDGYVVEAVDSDVASVASTKKVVVKMTAAEKATAIETKKAEKEAEKAVKKAEKDAEKAEKKAEKDAEKAEKKAEKEAEKAEKKAVKKPTVPAAAVKKIVPAAAKKIVPAAAATAAAPVEAVAKKAAVPVKSIKNPLHPLPHKAEEWTCPSDGMVHPWAYKGKNYLRNSENETWLRGEDGGCGEWQGIYLVKENRIDDSVPEPEFEDDA